MSWQLAEAKNKLSEVVTQALTNGPQRIHRRGQVVVVVAEAEYEQLTGAKPDFKTFLLSGPDLTGVDLTRDTSPLREVTW
jgi:prevent-host-death family protein